MRKFQQSTVLVALMPSVADWVLALKEHWYRIPVNKAPPIVREKTATHIAFYFPKAFGKEAYSIRWVAEVTGITVHERRELLATDAADPRAKALRFKVSFGELKALPVPIQASKGRRLLFVPTTLAKLQHATEINDLFNDSPLEDMLWERLKADKIPTERQHYVEYDEGRYLLDFAIFCKLRALAVECDGDAWHNPAGRVHRDKRRDALLQSNGWSVLRFTTPDIVNDLPITMDRIHRTVNELGGVQLLTDPDAYRYLRTKGDGQGRLFD